MILDALTREAVIASVLAFVGLILHECFRNKAVYEVRPKTPRLPIIGAKAGEWFPAVRALWRNSIDIKTATQKAYQFKDELCLLPVIDLGRVVMIPPTDISWYLEQPDWKINSHDHVVDAFQLKWTITDPQIVLVDRPVHNVLIRTKLTREINNLIPVLAANLPSNLFKAWGNDTEHFREVCPLHDLPGVFGHVVNLVFAGVHPGMVESSINFAKSLVFTTVALRMTPQVLRPLLAPFLTLPQRYFTLRFYKALRPEINRRLQELRADPHSTTASKNDFLQWAIDAAIESEDPYMIKPETLMGRLLILNFVSVHTSSLAITDVLLDLAASSPAYVEELRTEIIAALNAHGGQWSKRMLDDMPKLDSVFRESQRMNPPSMIGSVKLVRSQEGVTTPSGVHLRYGTCLGIPGYASLRDPALYPDPYTFKPFRFAERREVAERQGLKIEKARQAWTAADNKTHHTFGAGRHACPGRFFAAATSKVFLAHILMNYDIEQLQSRPTSPTIGMASMPPFKETIRVRRWKAPSSSFGKG